MLAVDIDISEKLKELDQYIDSLPEKEGALIPVLHMAQELIGFLPEEVQDHIARKLVIPASRVYGVVSFYSFFNVKPKGKIRVNICMGTACFVRGAQDVLDEFAKLLHIAPGETSEDMLFSLDALRCIGACGLAPVITVNNKYYRHVTVSQVKEIVEEHMATIGGIGDE